MKKVLFLAFLFTVSAITTSYAQEEVCESPDTAEVDLNSITKCAITPLKNSKDKRSRQIKVKVSGRRRMLKKRTIASANSLSTSSGIASSTVKKESVNLGQISSIQKEDNVKQHIENLKNKLSKEEVSKALRFTTVDKIPTFKACEKVKRNDKSDCFNNEMIKHISKHFSYPGAALISQTEGEVWVRFIIDKDGYVKNIKALGPDEGEVLNNEAIRVVSKLPRFKPAKKDGKRTSVKYGFPINFSLEE